MLKKFLMKKMLRSQLKGVSEEDKNRIMTAVEENPELFQRIGLDIQQKIKEGKDQMSATMEVMRKYQGELEKIKI